MRNLKANHIDRFQYRRKALQTNRKERQPSKEERIRVILWENAKVLNKYYSPDFDPKKIPRLRKPNNQQKKIRFMLPVRVRCNTCGN
ncbi:hypothetical protein YC2023_050384 [Brassica napus]